MRGSQEVVILNHSGYRVSVWNEDKLLEIDSGDGCTTL